MTEINNAYVIHEFKIFMLMTSLLLFVACSGNSESNKDMQEAFRVHQEAVKTRQITGDQMEKLLLGSDSLFEATYKNELSSIKDSLKAWDEQLVEVPGFEEEHDHSGHDHHSHETTELSPKQHLEVQQHLLLEIQTIKKNLEQINNR